MLTGGNVTVFVANMDRAVRFYSETLGFPLVERYGDHWASVDAGGLRIGLHPASAENPAGRRGSISIGFGAGRPLEEIVATLERRGVTFDGPIRDDKGGRFVGFSDPDGHPCYIFQTTRGQISTF